MIIIKGVAIFDLIIRNEISEPKKAGKMECVVDFKSFPFLVPEWQRRRLERYRAAAVACEQRLEADRLASLQLLRERVARLQEQQCIVVAVSPTLAVGTCSSSDRDPSAAAANGARERRNRMREQGPPATPPDTNAHLCAVARGFLTRRLLASEKVQHLAKTVRDASAVLDTMRGSRNADSALKHRLCTQLQVARQTVHEIFFELPVEERLAYIAHTRLLRHERSFRAHEVPPRQQARGRLSAATLKSLQRRQEGGGASVSGRGRKAPTRRHTNAVAKHKLS